MITIGHERSGASRGFDGRSPHRRLWSDRFVGRERQLERIAVGLQAAVDGNPSALVLSGTAGLGLSRLLGETMRRIGALAEPFATVHGVAVPATAGVPYAPITAALERLLIPVPADTLAALVGPTGDAIARLVPSLRPRLEELELLPDRPRIAATEWREARMFEAVLGLLERLGERQPVALLLEDLHHADAATRGLVTFLSRVTRGQRVFLVGTYQPDRLLRSDPLRATISTLASSPSVTTAEVAPLERAELGQLIESIEGARPSSTTLLLVAERSRGNPLIAEELLAARRELLGISMAGTFDRIVTARAALRSPECRRVLRLLSLAGSMVTLPMLMSMAAEFEARSPSRPPRSASGARHGDVLESDFLAGVTEALEYGFLVETSDGPAGAAAGGLGGRGGERGRGVGPEDGSGRPVSRRDGGRAPAGRRDGANGTAREGRGGSRHEDDEPAEPERTIGFRHELVAEAIAADLLPGTRRRYHSALAAARSDADDPSPAAALEHHLAAHELAEAEADALDAAAVAEGMDAGADALTHYERALDLFEIVRPDETIARLADIYIRAAEAAFAAGDPARASAYAEAAAAGLDDPRERLALGIVMDQLGRYRRAAGDHEGALAAHRRAVELVPPEPTAARARVLASLAQFRMLEGVFSEAKRYAQEAVDVAAAVGDEARQEMLHATCTLAVADAWGEDPEPAVWRLRQTRDEAAGLGRLDDLFRVYANLTTVLDLLGRREEAIAIAYEGIAEAERAGQATVYGNFLRANAAESSFFLGRWSECRRLCLDALSWSPVGIWYLSPLHSLATLEVAQNAGESAGRLLGQVLLSIETVQDPQFSVPAHQTAAAYALWQEDLVDAHRAAERGWLRVADTEDWLLMARMAATYLEVDAAVAQDAHRRRDFAALAATRERSLPVVLRAEAVVRACGVSPKTGSRRQADLAIRTARAYRGRVEGHDDAATWKQLALDWAELGDPYEAARARWREAEALLDLARGRSTRTVAREPLTDAAEAAFKLGAWPLLRAVAELARRAMLPLPKQIEAQLTGRAEQAGQSTRTAGRAGAPSRPTPAFGLATRQGPGSQASAGVRSEAGVLADFVAPSSGPAPHDFGLSKRELEVLALIAEGRTNPEIGRRLFITRKTVAVHVSNILTKLGVSGRVEAAAAAIRLGITDRD
ncbi:MAG: LuxR C-terminal-related transcriptional regulator [Candidatus Limnocylindrales bacterium]|jgi:DNA-binding CsgD family transcriptional regulator/predicted ATPase